MHPALLYLPEQRLSLAELCAARLDGHVVEVGEGYLPADTVESPSARALAIGHLMPAGTAAMGPSAAWIIGAGDAPPARHHILRSGAKRVRAPSTDRVVFHEMTATGPDLIDRLGIALTTPVRTLCDLSRMRHAHPDFASWAVHLSELRPGLAEKAVTAAEQWRRLPGKADAIAFLRGLAGREAMTR